MDIDGVVIGFLSGTLSTYLANRFLDLGRGYEGKKKDKRRFDELIQKMPELIQEMQKDLSGVGAESIRVFFVLPSKNVMFWQGQPGFIYIEEEHENLLGKIEMILFNGYIKDITEPGKNVKRYIMSEEFVKQILRK